MGQPGQVRRLPLLVMNNFMADKIPAQAAALAYYAVLSLAPLLLVAVAIAGLFLGQADAQSEMARRLEEVMGPEAAKMAVRILHHSRMSHHGGPAVAISLGIALVGATGVFSQLQDTLNTIWKVTGKPGVSAVATFFRKRLLTFLVLLAAGGLLIAAMMLSTVLAALKTYLGLGLPGSAALWNAINIGVTFGLSVVLFALVYRILPDVRLAWRHVWWGAIFTAALFAAGRVAIGQYIRYSGAASAYGAAGALVVLLLWVYYSSIIFLLGAEFIHAYTVCRGLDVPPAKYAVKINTPKPLEPGQPSAEGDCRK